MNMFMFSPSQAAFYFKDQVLLGIYKEIPDDLIDVPDEIAAVYQGEAPEGYWRGADEDGMPAWVLLPPPAPEDIEAVNKAEYASRYAYATQQISLLTDATDEDIMGDDIDPNDVTKLKAWKKYRVELSRMTDMLNPVWPVIPS